VKHTHRDTQPHLKTYTYRERDTHTLRNRHGERNTHGERKLSRRIMKTNTQLARNLLVRRMLRRRTEDCLPVGCDFSRETIITELNGVEQAFYDAIVDDPFFTASEKMEWLRRQCLESETKYDLLRAAVQNVLERPKYKKAKQPPKMIIAESSYAKGITRDHRDERNDQKAGAETYMLNRLKNDLGDSVEIFVLDRNNSSKREAILEAFEQCKKPAAFVSLIAAMGEGLDISCASDGILITPPFTVSAEEQFFRRMLRKGQTLPVHLQVLQFRNTWIL